LPANGTNEVATYDFENPAAFLADFGVTATFGSYTPLVILSMPGEDLLGARIESNQYEMEYLTTALPGLAHGSSVVINAVTYSVLQTYQLDDGTFSRARLQT
jgi:hypothetical protein